MDNIFISNFACWLESQKPHFLKTEIRNCWSLHRIRVVKNTVFSIRCLKSSYRTLESYGFRYALATVIELLDSQLFIFCFIIFFKFVLKAVINEDTQGNVRQLQSEVKKLKEQLAVFTSGKSVHDISLTKGKTLCFFVWGNNDFVLRYVDCLFIIKFPNLKLS